jgi:hypothetical protein
MAASMALAPVQIGRMSQQHGAERGPGLSVSMALWVVNREVSPRRCAAMKASARCWASCVAIRLSRSRLGRHGE